MFFNPKYIGMCCKCAIYSENVFFCKKKTKTWSACDSIIHDSSKNKLFILLFMYLDWTLKNMTFTGSLTRWWHRRQRTVLLIACTSLNYWSLFECRWGGFLIKHGCSFGTSKTDWLWRGTGFGADTVWRCSPTPTLVQRQIHFF